MEKVRIKNLRALKDTKEISLKPITILLGKNSIGKSTFLRMYPLFKQSLLLNRSEPLLWYSPQLVDFGNFKEAVLNNSLSNDIIFDFEFFVPHRDIIKQLRFFTNIKQPHLVSPKDIKDESIQVKTGFSIHNNHLSSLKIDILDYNILFLYNKSNVILEINGIRFEDNVFKYNEGVFLSNEIFPKIFSNDKNIDEANTIKNRNLTKNKIFLKQKSILKPIINGRISDEKIKDILNRLYLCDLITYKQKFEKLISNTSTMIKKYNEMDSNDRDSMIEQLHDINAITFINIIIGVVNNYLRNYFQNAQYIAPVRASAERYYRIQGLPLEDISPQGENIPMILKNLSDKEEKQWKKWTKEKFGIQFNIVEKEANISVNLIKNGREINLADTGFGYSQLLPILIYCWRIKNNKRTRRTSFFSSVKEVTLIVEQPELHLHPALQAQLVDVFVGLIDELNQKSQKIQFKIIFETHSETIVNYLGELISESNKIDNSMVNILLFEEGQNSETTIREVKYSESGYLLDWPIDFFMTNMEKEI